MISASKSTFSFFPSLNLNSGMWLNTYENTNVELMLKEKIIFTVRRNGEKFFNLKKIRKFWKTMENPNLSLKQWKNTGVYLF